jgi:hypothetical protein
MPGDFMTAYQDWIERAKSITIESEIARRGIKLAGKNERSGPCPVCGGSDRFSINIKKQAFNCRGCRKGGSVIDLVMMLDNLDFHGACEKLSGEPPPKANGHDTGKSPPKPNGYDVSKSRHVGTWIYRDADDRPYLKVERFDKPDGSKSYPQSHWDGAQWVSGKPAGPKIPYRLPELLDSDRTEPVWITEGEKCADAVAGLGLTATSASEGAGKWTAELDESFRDRIAYILPDKDLPGAKHGEQIAQNLTGIAREVRIVALPGLGEGEDVYEWIERGGTAAQLEALGAAAPEYNGSGVEQGRRSNGNGAGTCPIDPNESKHWDDPDWSILDDRRGTLPEFPEDIFSLNLQAWLERAARGAGVSTAHVAVPMLGIASSLIGMARCVYPVPSWPQPCSMWTAIVGFSGSGKTPGIDVTERTLARIGRDRRERIAGLDLAHQTKAEAAKVAHKKWKADVEAAIEAGKSPPQMPPEATVLGPFVAPRLFVSNATIERLAVLLQANPRGMLMIAKELAGLFLNMGRYSRGQDNEFWLESYDGKPYTVERMGRPAIAVDHLLVGIVGGLQPDKLSRSFSGDADGMYARFCFAWPSEPGYRPLSDEADEIDPVIYNTFARLIDLPSEEEGVFASRKIALSADAREEFEKFLKGLHDHRSTLEGREREWVSKCPSHVLRLAGTLAYLNWAAAADAEPKHIDATFVDAAIRLVTDYFWPHSRAALRQIGLSERHANARRVLKWVRAHGKIEVSREEIRREALGQALDAEATQALLDTLSKAAWCRSIKSVVGRSGGRPSLLWRFNPLLYGSAAETAETAETSAARSTDGKTLHCDTIDNGGEGVSAVSAVAQEVEL